MGSPPLMIPSIFPKASESIRECKALPHNSSAALAMPFLPSASCRNLDLPPVNLRFLQSHLTKNAFAIAPIHLCGIAVNLLGVRFTERQKCDKINHTDSAAPLSLDDFDGTSAQNGGTGNTYGKMDEGPLYG
jgi:hypothetical protein